MSLKEKVNKMTTGAAAKHLLNLLEPFPYAVVRYEYHGANDSLNNDELILFSTMGEYDKSEPASDDVASDKLGADLVEGLSEFGYAVTEAHYGGWENNEGGHGTVDYIVHPDPGDEFGPRVIQNHWDYVQEEVHRGEHVY
jgi:hypothetical protein